MGTSVRLIIFPFVLLCFLCFPHFNASVENCLNNRCGKRWDEPAISYPFRIKGLQGKRCGYPGFDLTCDTMNRTVLDLPVSGRFFVYKILYGSTFNEIQLRDPNNCLARRFLNQLNLTGTPLIGIKYINNSFFSCQSDNYNSSKDVRCLGNSTHRVFTTTSSTSSLWTHANCMFMATIPVPYESYMDGSENRWFQYEKVLHLSWSLKAPYCKQNCDRQSNFPSFRNLDASPGPSGGKSKTSPILLGILIPTVLICMWWFFVYIIRMRLIYDGIGRTELTNFFSQLVTTTTGLNGSEVQSLPTIVIGESGRLPNPDDSTCLICLSEYQPKDTLKIFPGCNHSFHADCVDIWLNLNSTCPICRISFISLNASPGL